MGALEIMGQVDLHVETGDGVLLATTAVPDPDGMADVLYTDFVDGYAPDVGTVLHIGNRYHIRTQCSFDWFHGIFSSY
jgi:hypothetical protein